MEIVIKLINLGTLEEREGIVFSTVVVRAGGRGEETREEMEERGFNEEILRIESE